MMKHDRHLCHVLSAIADDARLDGRELPVIETDRMTAQYLANMLKMEMSADMVLRHDHPENAFGVIAMFDGVKIKERR